ncbi:MAG: prolyl oligopeptidase family serine peptidase [Deltaproteobacteria bacterium]|nr:prolyl oligopeptidase family serine peptidase [Deltaproteobacteria bacterium]
MAALVAVAASLVAKAAAADLGHDTVDDGGIDVIGLVDAAARPGSPAASMAWSDLARPKKIGSYVIEVRGAGEAVYIPHCNGRGKVSIDGVVKDPGSKGAYVLPLEAGKAHDVRIEVAVSTYEKRIACGERIRIGPKARSTEGIARLRFPSPSTKADAGEAVVFVPPGHDPKKPGALLVGTHPWNGSPWTYAAYRELLEEAQAKDVVLLMPSGLGNLLYIAEAEDEVMRAIDALEKEVAIDRRRVSIWGASMGGAGATTISFHRPDRFAFVASWFGDSKYDVTTYVRSLLPTDAQAKRVNALDVVENARHLPVFLVHGEDDRTSPIVQSTMLYDAMKKNGFSVELERVPGMGHEGPLVVKYIRKVVDRAADAKAPEHPSRVSFRSVRPSDTAAYGVRLVRAGEGDAFVDLEKRDDGIHVLAATGVKEIVLDDGALGATRGDPIARATVPVRWR